MIKIKIKNYRNHDDGLVSMVGGLCFTFCCFIYSMSYLPMIGAQQTNTNLKFVSIVFRHGSRAPSVIYPTSLNAEYWKKYGGPGQITREGMRQLYELGSSMRDYYRDFLPKFYDRNKLYARSTDVDRNLISAYTFLAGLYQPTYDQIWYNSLSNWLPIPVHTVPTKDDPLYNYGIGCNAHNYFRNLSLNSQEYQEIEQTNKEFVSLMANLSGIPDLDYYKLWIISDNTLNEQIENLRLPDWVNQYYNQIMEAKDFGYSIDYGTTEKALYFGGGLMNELVTNIKNKLNDKITYDMMVYSNHDNIMSGLLGLLNFSWPLREIPYGSAIVFELRQDIVNTSQFYVQLLFKNNTFRQQSNLYVVEMNGCSKLCPIEEFLNLTANKVITDYNGSCKNSQPPNHSRFMNICNILLAMIIYFQSTDKS